MDKLQVTDVRTSVTSVVAVIISVVGTIEEPTLNENSPLNGKCSEKEIETKGRPWVSFQECHQETETNDDHDVDILEP